MERSSRASGAAAALAGPDGDPPSHSIRAAAAVPVDAGGRDWRAGGPVDRGAVNGQVAVGSSDVGVEPTAIDLRAGDADRQDAADHLIRACGEGRITLAELDGRVAAAWRSRTYRELAAVTADLPRTAAAGSTVGHPEADQPLGLAATADWWEMVGGWAITCVVALPFLVVGFGLFGIVLLGWLVTVAVAGSVLNELAGGDDEADGAQRGRVGAWR